MTEIEKLNRAINAARGALPEDEMFQVMPEYEPQESYSNTGPVIFLIAWVVCLIYLIVRFSNVAN